MQDVNDIVITHLSVDHDGELPYLYCLAPWAGRWTPGLRGLPPDVFSVGCRDGAGSFV